MSLTRRQIDWAPHNPRDAHYYRPFDEISPPPSPTSSTDQETARDELTSFLENRRDSGDSSEESLVFGQWSDDESGGEQL